jgi:hypothetical protein
MRKNRRVDIIPTSKMFLRAGIYFFISNRYVGYLKTNPSKKSAIKKETTQKAYQRLMRGIRTRRKLTKSKLIKVCFSMGCLKKKNMIIVMIKTPITSGSPRKIGTQNWGRRTKVKTDR